MSKIIVRPQSSTWVRTKRWVFCLGLGCAVLCARATDLYVAPGGLDTNPGTAAQPLATILGAQQILRALNAGSGLPSGGVTVWLQGGYYNLTATALFTSGDSGTATSPIVYASAPGGQAHLTGSVNLDPAQFKLVDSTSPIWSRLDPAAQGNVYQVNLSAQGVGNLGTLKPRGFNLRATAPLELFYNGEPMTLAQWPNVGQPMALTGTVLSSTQLSYTGSRPSRWTQATDVWMHGLWSQDWADFHVAVAAINPATRTITLASPPAQYGLASLQPYYAYNLLEELDTPGEYYVDRSSGILYFWPPTPLAGSIVQASVLEDSLLTLNGVSYLTFRGLVLEASRGPLVTQSAGDHVQFDSCVLRNAGQFAALIAGTNSGITQSQISFCGEEGVRLDGGDRPSLTAAHNYVTSTRIHGTARVAWTYRPGISFEGGCGNSAANNLLDDMPHAAILFSGDNHLIAYNEIWHVCQLTSDAGAIYAGQDWGFRGDIIANNYLHDINTQLGTSDVNGVYLDDCMSGAQVEDNIFYNIAGTALFCGGGRDTIMENNVIALCGMGHYNDDRGRTLINANAGDSWNLLAKLSGGGILYQQGVWARAYPACAAIPNSWSILQTGLWLNPQNCVFSANAGWSNTAWTFQSNSSGTGVFGVYASFTNNDPAQPAMFGAAAALDRTQRPATVTATATIPGFQPVPFAAIGPLASAQAAATLPPPPPVLYGQIQSAAIVGLTWDDQGGIWNTRTAGFEVQQAATAGAWTAVQTWGPDVDFTSVTGLPAATTTLFRLRAYNANGSSYSNPVSLTTPAAPLVASATLVIQAALPLTVIADLGKNGHVVAGAAIADDSAGTVVMYDAGDAIQINFTVPTAGTYALGLRARSGGSTGTTSYWPNGYQATLDGTAVPLTGDPSSLSALDPSYGGSFWGTMASAPLTLAAGPHAVIVTAEASWGGVESLTVTTLVPASGTITTANGTGTTTSGTGAGATTTGTATTGPGTTTTGTAGTASAALFTSNADIGTVTTPGTSNVGNGVYTLTNAGADIWNGTVAFHYDYQSLNGDGSITARVASLQNTETWAKAGVMIRASLNPQDAFAAVYVTPGSGVAFQWSPTLGASDNSLQAGGAAPAWVQLTRAGSLFTASTSADGVAWTVVGTTTIAMNAQVYVGLCLCSHDPNTVATATFDSVTLAGITDATSTTGTTSTGSTTTGNPTTGTTTTGATTTGTTTTGTTSTGTATSGAGTTTTGTGAPTGTPTTGTGTTITGTTATATALFASNADIGPVTTAGTSSVSDGIYTLTNAGADIWNGTVAFQYDYQTLNGDGSITARVSSLQNTETWAKAGVMIRASLNPQDVFAAVYVTPGSGVNFQWCPAIGASDNSLQTGGAAPAWVQLTRMGNLFTASTSPDGVTWTVVGTTTLAMNTQVYVGLCLCSHDPSTVGTATFDSVTVTGTAGTTTTGTTGTTTTSTGTGTNSTGTTTTGTSTGSTTGTTTSTGTGASTTGTTTTGTSTTTTGTTTTSTATALFPSTADIGTVTAPGTSSANHGVYTLTNAGADIWNGTVAFQYDYQTLTGDGAITARVASVQNTETWAKAGVMIRASLNPQDVFAAVYVTPGSGLAFQWCPAIGASDNSLAANGGAPTWVRLTRAGNTFTASTSPDGVSWTVVGATTVAMNAQVYVGLCLCSHDPGTIATAVFDSVSIAAAP